MTPTLEVKIPEVDPLDPNHPDNVDMTTFANNNFSGTPQEEETQTSIAPTTEEKAIQPTVVSTDSMRKEIEGAQERLDAWKAEQAASEEEVIPTATTEETPPPEEGEAELSDIDIYANSSQQLIDERSADFNRYMTRSDNLLKSQVKSIQKTFDVRKNQAIQTAANAKAASTIVGSRSGRLRYAPEIQAGIITGQENAKIKLLSEIDSLELASMAAAEKAAYDRDYETFLDEIENIDKLRKDREDTIKELNQIMEEENEKREQEMEDSRNEIAVVEQLALGVTDPIEVFQTLNGKVPFDVIKSYTDTLGTESTEPVKLGRYDRLVDPKTGKVIAGQALGSSGGGGGDTTAGGGWITDADLDAMSLDERDFVNKVIRQLPTKLKDSEQEKKERMKEALFDFRRGRGIQEVVDEMNSFIIADDADKGLGNVFRSLSVGSGVDLGEISAAMNTGNPTLAMTTVENAKLQDAAGFFSKTDDARNIVSQANRVVELMNSMSEDTLSKMGSWDGREFKVKRFANTTDAQDLEIQKLNSAMQLLNAPLRVAIAGTAVTSEEMKKIDDFQADIMDQPDIAKTKIAELSEAILNFHNQARTQRGLPQVDTNELVDESARLGLYEGMVQNADATAYEGMSNSDLFFDNGGEMDIYETIGLGEDN